MKKPVIVLLSDHLQGGAAMEPNLLANDLAQRGDFEVHRWHFSPPVKDFFHPAVLERSLSLSSKRPRIERIIKNISKRIASLMRNKRNERALIEAVSREKPDLLHIHNIHSADINQSTLSKLPAEIPIVWTLHDFWPLRAVAFSWSEREENRLKRHEIGPWSRRTLLQKRDIFFSSKRNVTLVAPSLYVQRVVRHYSARHQIPCKFIPHVVNRTFFLPHDRAAARIHWNLDPDKLWIGVGSTWNNSRKGMDVLWRALSLIDCRSLGLMIWGHESNPQHPIRDLVVRSVGHVEDVERLATLYAAVDLFVCPTKADTGPLTVIESMAVGTPPLASKVGGIPERVTHEHNGLLFPSQDHESLAVIIAECVKKPYRLHELGSNARELAQHNFNPDHHVDLHCQLYQQIIRQATS